MQECFFVTDLHGKISRYESLFRHILQEKPEIVFIGGDLFPLPHNFLSRNPEGYEDFLKEFMVPHLQGLREQMQERYPKIFIIMGNDDLRINEPIMQDCEAKGIWTYAHNRKTQIGNYQIYGYSYVPPTPFNLKDWERYDVSRFTDVGCVSPEEGFRSVEVNPDEVTYSTIEKDLENLTKWERVDRAIFLFHTPPYDTWLDRAGLDGRMVDHTPLDVHVGSIAVRRFIEQRQPLITLHGHIHESTEITGQWQQQLGNTYCFNAAHNGRELSIIKFNIENPSLAKRFLV